MSVPVLCSNGCLSKEVIFLMVLQDLSVRKSHVQRWLFPPSDDTPPPSEEDKLPDLELELENAPSYQGTPVKKDPELQEKICTPIMV